MYRGQCCYCTILFRRFPLPWSGFSPRLVSNKKRAQPNVVDAGYDRSDVALVLFILHSFFSFLLTCSIYNAWTKKRLTKEPRTERKNVDVTGANHQLRHQREKETYIGRDPIAISIRWDTNVFRGTLWITRLITGYIGITYMAPREIVCQLSIFFKSKVSWNW